MRIVLPRALLVLLGRTSRVLPRWLDRRLPQVAIEGERSTKPRPTLKLAPGRFPRQPAGSCQHHEEAREGSHLAGRRIDG